MVWAMLSRQTQIRCTLALLVALIGLALVGCGSDERRNTPWAWTEPARTGWQPDPTPLAQQQASIDPHDASIAVFNAYQTGTFAGAEAIRRDNIMGIRDEEVLPNRLAWPRERRPSLDRTRSYRGSTTPERWVYPSDRRDRRHYGGYRPYHGGGR